MMFFVMVVKVLETVCSVFSSGPFQLPNLKVFSILLELLHENAQTE